MTPRVEVGSEEGGVAWIKSIISESKHTSRDQKSIIRERAHRPISTQSTVTHWAITTSGRNADVDSCTCSRVFAQISGEANALFSPHPNIGIIDDFILMS